MAGIIKHVGKHGDRKVAIIYRVVPGEEHMALVTYPETLPTFFHDALIRVIESAAGQQSAELADALFKDLLPDGRPILQTLHKEGMIKKVPTAQIIVTPNATSHVRLDELNKIFDGMKEGADAAQKMQDIDKNLGLVDPSQKRAIEATIPELGSSTEALDDLSLAGKLDAQANQLALDAKGLLAESKRLKAEAKALKPKPEKKASTKKKTAKRKAVVRQESV